MNMLKMRVSTVLAIALTISLLIVGLVGFVLSYFNPVNDWILPYVQTCIDYQIVVGCWLEPSLVYLGGVIEILNDNWVITLPTSIVVFAMGLLQPESRRNIRAFPSKVISTYSTLRKFRDFVFQKVDTLNSESQKWRRAFNVAKSPYSFLRMMGFSPQMAIGLLAVGSTAGTGVIASETVFSERSFARGDSGIYEAPLDVPTSFNEQDNTLAINLGEIPVREITLKNISVGEIFSGDEAGSKISAIPSVCDANDPAKTGTAKCPAVLISGKPAVAASGDTPAFVATRLEVGELIIEKNRCFSMDFKDMDIHSVFVEYNSADGISIYQTPGSGANRAVMGGHHSASAMETSSGTYDRVVITAPNSGVNGKVGKLTLSNIYSKGAAGCVFKNMEVGTLRIIQNEVGNDSNLVTKEFKLHDSLKGANWLVRENVELILPEPALNKGNQ